MDGILHDAYRNIVEEAANTQGVGGPTAEAKRFFKLVEEGKKSFIRDVIASQNFLSPFVYLFSSVSMD